MAVATSNAVAQPQSRSPYQLDLSQTATACKFLLKHIREQRNTQEEQKSTKNLLATNDEEETSDLEDTAVWLVVSCKKHIVDKKRLKPGKIPVPHSINSSPTNTICLITADPQRIYKEAVDHPSFPETLRKRITVIGFSKLKSEYKSYESRRKLLAEHDIFLADERISTLLPGFLGKIFYKGGAKRPITTSIAGPVKRDENGKKVSIPREIRRKTDNEDEGLGVASPPKLVKEIEKSLASAVVMLSPGASTAVKVGRATMAPEHCLENIQAVVAGLTEKYITKGWSNVKGLHIKGPNTMAVPIWLAEELWMNEEDVLEEKPQFGKKAKTVGADEKLKKALENGSDTQKAKRKAEQTEKPAGDKHAKKKRRAASDAATTASVKANLKKQKAKVKAEVDGAVI